MFSRTYAGDFFMSKVMLITGASRGIGAATARLAAAEGYALCLNFRQRHDAAEQLLKELRSQGAQAIAIEADIADESQVVRLVEAVDAGGSPTGQIIDLSKDTSLKVVRASAPNRDTIEAPSTA